jgi:VWFA-related protein
MHLSRRELLATLPVLGRLRAQEGTAAKFSADVQLVNVFATVRDGNNRVVKDLAKDDFELYEDGRRQTIRHFAPVSNLPLRVGQLADISGSMLRRIRDERAASRRFFRQVLRPQQDRAFLIRFDSQIDVVQGLTGSPDLLDKATGYVGRSLGGSPSKLRRPAAWSDCNPRSSSIIRDAVLLTCEEILRKERGRKALILLSDGIDGGSCMPIRAAVESAQRAEAIVYTLLFMEPRAAQTARREGTDHHPGRALMEQLAGRTGGRMFLPGIDGSVAKAYSAIEEDLRHQYGIGYTPDRPSPGFHEIRLATRQQYSVRTRQGYYSE